MYFEKPDKKFCLLIILASAAGFLAGLLLIGNSNLISTEKAGLFSDYYLRQYSYLEIDRAELAWMIARERGKWLLLMWALGFTWAGMFCVYLFAGLWGFFGAVLIGMAFIKKGIFLFCILCKLLIVILSCIVI